MSEPVELPRVERCETCKFWDTMGEELDSGYCRLFPPVANVAQICYGMMIKVDQVAHPGGANRKPHAATGAGSGSRRLEGEVVITVAVLKSFGFVTYGGDEWVLHTVSGRITAYADASGAVFRITVSANEGVGNPLHGVYTTTTAADDNYGHPLNGVYTPAELRTAIRFITGNPPTVAPSAPETA